MEIDIQQTDTARPAVVVDRQEELLDGLLAEGVTEESILLRLRKKSHDRFVAKRLELPPKTPLNAAGWAAHKAWHLDPQPVYGELKDFYVPGRAALEADDQEEFARQKDLLFKAVGSFLQQEWQKYIADLQAAAVEAEAGGATEEQSV